MDYRLFQPDDFDELYAIEEACFEPPHRFTRRYLRQLIDQRSAATWVAENSDRMCGFGVVEWNGVETGMIAYIQTIEVVDAIRGRGIGAALMRHMEQSARDAGAMAIWLHVDAKNAAAIRLYAAHGYYREGREEGYYGRGRDALVQVKQLGPS